MAAFREQISILAIKQEATEGTAETSSLTQTVRAENINFQPTIMQTERNIQAETFGDFASVPGSKMATLSFSVYGVGAASLANLGSVGAELHTLFLASGLDDTLSANTSATYTPETTITDLKSVTIRTYHDGLFYVLRGARARRMTIVGESGRPLRFDFEFLGVYDYEQGEGSTPSNSFLTVTPAPLLSAAIAINSVSVVVRSFSIEYTTGAELRPNMNNADGYTSAVLTRLQAKGRIRLEPELVATFDTPSQIEDLNERAFTVSTGTGTTANKTTITAPKLQMVQYRPVMDGGLVMYDVDFNLNRSSGDDFLSIAYTAG